MSLNYIDIDLMNEYQKQKVKMKDSSNDETGDKPPDENQDNPNEDKEKEGGGVDGKESEGN